MSRIHPHAKGEENEVRTFWEEGYFCGYNETSKACKIYIPGQRQIEDSWDVSFSEEVAFKRSRETHNEEQEAPKDDDPSSTVVHPLDHEEESVESTEPVDLPRDVAVIRKRPAWLHDTLQDIENHAAPNGTFC